MLTKTLTSDAETLRDVVLERLHAISEVSTQTLFVLDEAELAADVG